MVFRILVWDATVVTLFLATDLISSWLPILALTAAFSSPLILAWLTGRQRSLEKREDWRREDEVAARAAQAARLLLDSQERVARKVAEVATTTAKASSGVSAQLNQIHTLVNSNMTLAMDNELVAYRSNLVLLKAEQMRSPTPELVVAIGLMSAKITELDAQLHDRKVATDIAQRQVGI
jgi:hypothetical protein